MPARLTAVVAIVLAAGVGLAFRLPGLALRPMHTDEAVHAIKTGELLASGRYVYDPNEFHGPTPYYAALAISRLAGARSFSEVTEGMLRAAPVLFGICVVLLLLGVQDGLGRVATAIAGTLTAVSPAMVFYSRYYIQEMLLVCFTFGTIMAGWRYSRTPRVGWAIVAGACVGLMHASKETAAFAVVCMGAALFLTLRRGRNERFRWAHALWAVAAAAFVSTLLLSCFFTNLHEPLDAVRAYLKYAGRAAADPARADGAAFHVHAWYYYFSLLLFFKNAPGPWWSEAAIVGLAALGFAAAFWFPERALSGHRGFARFLAWYTLLMTVLYAAIPYKTPWCLLGFLHGMILLAGVGAAAAIRLTPGRLLRGTTWVVLALAVYHLGSQAYRANFVYFADTRNPYVYAQTSTDLLKLVRRVEDVAQLEPSGRRLLIKVMTPGSDYWPLPWYLRDFPETGYWNDVPENPDAAIVIASTELEEALTKRLSGTYQQEYFGLRPGVLLAVYTRTELWDAFIRTRFGKEGIRR